MVSFSPLNVVCCCCCCCWAAAAPEETRRAIVAVATFTTALLANDCLVLLLRFRQHGGAEVDVDVTMVLVSVSVHSSRDDMMMIYLFFVPAHSIIIISRGIILSQSTYSFWYVLLRRYISLIIGRNPLSQTFALC